MTEKQKKALYAKSHAKWLKNFKNEFENYEDSLKVPLEKRWKLMEYVKAIWDLMAECGVCMYEKTEKPMSDIGDIQLKFETEGDPSTLREVLVSSHQSCWSVIKFEQTEEEIESEAERMAKMDVESAEWKEEEDRKAKEKRRKEQEEWEARNKEEAEHKAKLKKAHDEWQAKAELQLKNMRSWRSMVETLLDDIRKGEKHWYADEELSEQELKAVKKYVGTLFAFTDAQNLGMTGLALYHHNEARAEAHEDMLEVFGLTDNKYATEITKSYDFSDDYDHLTNKYKHLPEETVVNMLGFALLEAKNAEAADSKKI